MQVRGPDFDQGATACERSERPTATFENVLQHIQSDYVDEPNMERCAPAELRGLAYGLDPYSTYLTADQVKQFGDEGKKNEAGIGAELSQVASYLYVIAPMKGSPADEAGIRSGDIVECIDGKSNARHLALRCQANSLNGAAGTEVKLRVLRANTKPLTLTVKRSSFRASSAEARMEAGKMGIIKINSLDDGEAADVKARVQDLLKQGAQKLVLDLRDTAGGSLTGGNSSKANLSSGTVTSHRPLVAKANLKDVCRRPEERDLRWSSGSVS